MDRSLVGYFSANKEIDCASSTEGVRATAAVVSHIFSLAPDVLAGRSVSLIWQNGVRALEMRLDISNRGSNKMLFGNMFR